MSTDHTLPPLPVQDGVEYRRVAGFSRYCVGNDGSVWSCHSVYGRGANADSFHKLRPIRDRCGYLLIRLWRDGQRWSCRVHRLVLEAFVGPCPDGMEACHGDADPGNNRLDNLRWNTHRANAADTIRQGRTYRGEGHHSARLTPAVVLDIRRRVAAGEQQASIAQGLGVSAETISAVAAGKTWKHVREVEDA
jgi:hypothetical protein